MNSKMSATGTSCRRSSPPPASLLIGLYVELVANLFAAVTATNGYNFQYENPGFLDSVDSLLEDITTDNNMADNFVSDHIMNANHHIKPRRRADPTGVYSPLKLKLESKVSKRSAYDHQQGILPFLMQSDPKTVTCPPTASSTAILSGSKAVDFAAFAAGVVTLVLNINNNINNNNNNNNNLNLNAVDSSNVVASFNTNNANQVNIMPPGGKRRRRRDIGGYSAVSALAALEVHYYQSNIHLDNFILLPFLFLYSSCSLK